MTTEPGHFVTVNGHQIFGYSRYIDFYRDIVNIAKDGEVFVELGSFLGQSTAAMAAFIASSKKDISFYAVDLFAISEFSDEPHAKVIERHGGDFLAAYMDNLEKSGTTEFVQTLQGSSVDISDSFDVRSVDYLMIDASHKYIDVVEDITAWFPKITLGGIISGDDYDWSEVAKAVEDTLGPVNTIGSTWYVRKTHETLEEQRQVI